MPLDSRSLAKRFIRLHLLRLSTAGLISVGLIGCTGDRAPIDGKPPHHRVGGFRNNYTEVEPQLGGLARWRFEAWRDGLPERPATPTPLLVPDLGLIQSNAKAGARMQPMVTWIGHATVLAQFAGINMLTDPMFSDRASPLPFVGPLRHNRPGLWFNELPTIDLVLISHNHYDHLDEASVRNLAAQPGGPPLFVVPLGLKAWFAARDIHNVVELDWWQSHRFGAVEIVLTPVQHWSGRGLTDRLRTLWGGYAVFSTQLHLFFAGDTGYSNDFNDIRNRFAERQTPALGGGFDIALLPLGAYEPRWFMRGHHVNPEEVVRVHRDLAAKSSLGIHWGTFSMSDEALDEPPRALAAARKSQGVADSAFFTLALGETRRLPPRRPQAGNAR
jgi:N-acyl-phosphatidylethanolamine-hydrolysing phospholipase D